MYYTYTTYEPLLCHSLLTKFFFFFFFAFRAADNMFGCKNQVSGNHFTSACGGLCRETHFGYPCVCYPYRSRHQVFFFFLDSLHNRFRVSYVAPITQLSFPTDLHFRLRNKNKQGYRDLVKPDILRCLVEGLLCLEAPAGQKGVA